MASKRMLQIAEQIREHISMMLVRGEVSDPRIRNVTITSVKVTADLQTAKVYYSVIGDETTKVATSRGLKQAAGFMRSSLGETLQIRYTPHLQFFYDETIERAARMNDLLSKVREEREANEAEDERNASGE